MNENQQTTPQIDGAFLRTMQSHRRGECLSDLAEALREVTEQVYLTGKNGKVTLTLNLSPATAKGACGALVLEDTIKVTLPKIEKAGTIYFAHEETWNLQREDPQQQTLPLRTVEGSVEQQPAPLRQVNQS